ncbi:unnamed protein product [Arabidopsis halleri]
MTILCWREMEKGLLASMSALVLDYPDEYITYISGSFSQKKKKDASLVLS